MRKGCVGGMRGAREVRNQERDGENRSGVHLFLLDL